MVQVVVQKTWFAALLAGVFLLALGHDLSAGSSRPVYVGGEVEFDACGTSGIVVGLDPKGDNFLAVRAGPGSSYKTLDNISNGQSYFECDQHRSWLGIVYSKNPQVDCGVGSPIAKRQPYNGPCKSGWVFKKYTKPMAG